MGKQEACMQLSGHRKLEKVLGHAQAGTNATVPPLGTLEELGD